MPNCASIVAGIGEIEDVLGADRHIDADIGVGGNILGQQDDLDLLDRVVVGQVDVVVGAADEVAVSVYVDPQDIGPGAAIQHEIGRIQDTTARRGLISRVEQAHYQRSGTPVHNPETPTRIMRSYNDIRRLCRD